MNFFALLRTLRASIVLRGVFGDLGVDETNFDRLDGLFLPSESDILWNGDLRVLDFLDFDPFPDGVFFPPADDNRFLEDFLRLLEISRERVFGFFGLVSDKEDAEFEDTEEELREKYEESCDWDSERFRLEGDGLGKE